MSRHAELMDAAGYWKQFPVSAAFDKPCEYVGTVLELLNYKNPAGEYFPKIRLQQDDGGVVVIIASQARLLAALVEACPAKGDRVRIRYLGEGERAAFGLNKTKEFTVEVRRAGSQPPGRTGGTSGDGPDNGPEAGK